jgi:PAS domain S-box-containing protein
MTLAPDIALEEEVASALQGYEVEAGKVCEPGLRRQLALANASRRAAEAADEKALLADAARLIAESLDLVSCATALRVPDSDKLNFWYCNLGEAGPLGKETQVPLAGNESLAGFAIKARRPIVCSDLSQDQRFSDAFLLGKGVHSAVACPLDWAHDPWGTLLVLSPQPHRFEAEDVLLLDAISGVAAASISRRRAESEMIRQQRVRTAILETLEAIVIELSPEGRITTFNRACERVTGFAPFEVKDRHLWSAFLAPEEVVLVQGAFDRLHTGQSPVEFQSYLLTKHGQRRRISWSFAALESVAGKLETLIGTGLDITDRCQLQEMLDRSQSATDEARTSLTMLMSKIEAGELVFRANESQPFSEIPEGPQSERRLKPRRSYPYVQMVAPVIDGRLPNPKMFKAMRCKDIAAGGFSFLSPIKPNYAQCVAAFGVAPSLTYLMARIVHSRPIQHEGETLFIVGCEYTGRVEY